MITTDQTDPDKEMFENAFYNWLQQHGVDLAVFTSEMFSSRGNDNIIAKIDLNELKKGIIELIDNYQED